MQEVNGVVSRNGRGGDQDGSEIGKISLSRVARIIRSIYLGPMLYPML